MAVVRHAALYVLLLASCFAASLDASPAELHSGAMPSGAALQFAWGKVGLSSAHRRLLASVARLARKAPPGSRVRLRGFVGSVGSFTRNGELFTERARRIRSFLESEGVPSTSIVISPPELSDEFQGTSDDDDIDDEMAVLSRVEVVYSVPDALPQSTDRFWVQRGSIVVQYAIGSHELFGGGMRELEASLVGRDPSSTFVRIEGFTDSTGSERFNAGLSVRRAAGVRDFLRKLGVPASHFLIVRGLSSTRPRASNSHAHGRSLNRRVEVTYLEREEFERQVRELASPPAAAAEAPGGEPAVVGNETFSGGAEAPSVTADPFTGPSVAGRSMLVSAALTFSPSYYYPSIAVERLVTRQLSVGLSGALLSNLDVSSPRRFRGPALALSINAYYPGEFQLLWARFAALVSSIEASGGVSERRTVPGVLALVGLSLPTDVALLLRGGAGVHYVPNRFQARGFAYSGLSAVLHFEMAYFW